MSLNPELLEIIRCPKCQKEGREGRLALSAAGDALECEACRLRYPIVAGVPDMIVEEAKPF